MNREKENVLDSQTYAAGKMYSGPDPDAPISKIAYQNKDITSKVLAERFQGKTFRVYGLDLPQIIKAGPTNIPAVTASELRLDNLFELADHSVAIVDYESIYKKEDKIKYLNYLAGIANRYHNEKKACPILRMIVIYTGDVKRSRVASEYNIGALNMHIEAAFLTELDAASIYGRLTEKVQTGQQLTDEELMEFIILPLSFRTKEEKERKTEEMAALAEQIRDREQQLFVLAGLLAFADKIIGMGTANRIKEKIRMNKVEWLIRQDVRQECEAEKQQAVAKVLEEKQQAIAKLLEEKQRAVAVVERNYKKEKQQELKRAAKRFEKEKQEYEAKQQEYEAKQQEYEAKQQEYEAKQQEYEAKQQEYEAKLQNIKKWMADKGYAADAVLSELLH